MELEIKRILSRTIPYCGNKHTFPYGEVLISDGKTTKVVRFEENKIFTFKRKRYRLINNGNLYYPKYVIDEMDRED